MYGSLWPSENDHDGLVFKKPPGVRWLSDTYVLLRRICFNPLKGV